MKSEEHSASTRIGGFRPLFAAACLALSGAVFAGGDCNVPP